MLNLAAGQLLDIVNRFGIFRSDESKSAALGPCPACAANPVDIIIWMPRRIEIEDVGHAFDIEPARSHIGCDQNINVAGFETI